MTRNPSPISIGVPKSASELMNTSSEPASTVGRISGMTMQATLRAGPQPRLCDASSSDGSSFFIAPETYMKMNGYSLSASTRTMPKNP